MYFVGVDLHKHSISLCVMVQDSSGRRVIDRKRRPVEVVVEATAAYKWFARLIEPLAERFVLAHSKKLRVIAEGAKKTDELDAQTLVASTDVPVNGDVFAFVLHGPFPPK